MLVLGREVNQIVIINAPDGSLITIEPVDCKRGWCRLGITAPKQYVIHRGEIQAKVDAERGGGR